VSPSVGAALRRARKVRALSAVETARAAGISAAYLSKLENDAVKKPSPPVLLQLSEALAVPYEDLMRLTGYRVPGAPEGQPANANANAALFADITDAERDELVEYLAWYRERQKTRAR
jgi:transcriptional regulator with XRE-family HTH domain